MCRWIKIIILSQILTTIFALHLEGKNSLLTRRIRRHKKTEQFVPFESLFQLTAGDSQCSVSGTDRPMLSCPRQSASDPLKCIEFYELCDDHIDCRGGEDENPHFCLFKRLEDAEINRLKAEIQRLFVNKQGNVDDSKFKDFVIGDNKNGDKNHQKSDSGPWAKVGANQNNYDNDYEENEEDEKFRERRKRSF